MAVSSYFRYWGKAQSQDTNFSFHPLAYHSLDVAAVGKELVYNYRPAVRLAADLFLSLDEFADFFAFLLTLHDLGKFAISFQSQIKGNLSSILIPGDESKPYSIRHDTLGYWLWKDTKHQFFDLVWEGYEKESNRYRKIINQAILSVTGHHGLPPQEESERILKYFNENDIEAAREFISDLKKLVFFPKKLPTCFANKEYSKLFMLASWRLNGMAVLADWLGSNQEVFNYTSPDLSLEQYWNEQAQEKAKIVVNNAGLNYKIKTEKAIHCLDFLPHIKDLTPLQKYCSEVKLSFQSQLFILEDVTGSGKTEGALILAQRMIAVGLADGFYIGLPTMATANAMYERISTIYRKFFTEDSEPSVILSHSKRHLSDRFNQALQLNKVDFGNEEEGTATYWCNRWFADNRKKSLLADVGVGTLDQALASVLPYRHQTLRQLGLHKKILIVDEVHSYDKYTGTLLAKLLENHTRLGGSAILLSATLSQKMRQEFITAFEKGVNAISFSQLNSNGFPLITYVGKDQPIPNETPIEPRELCKRTVKIQVLCEESLILSVIDEALKNGQCVCWIRNTVKDTLNAYQLVQNQLNLEVDKVILFHSRFAMVDRLQIEGKVIAHFGKDSTAKQRSGYLLIATQVIEQSLDIDMDVLISDIAPIDLLIQRMGRLHRHSRDIFGNVSDGVSNLAPCRENPIFYTYAPKFEENPEIDWLKKALPGTQAVYEDVATIWLTQKLLMGLSQISLPEQARFLIESVYGELKNKVPVCFEKKSNDFEGKKRSEGSIANFNCIELEMGYSRKSNPYGWGSEVNTPTRLGDEKSEISLVVEEGDNLRPYAAWKNFPWDMSSLLVYENEENMLNTMAFEWTEKLKTLKNEYASLKNYTVIVPMVFDKDNGKYFIKDKRNQLMASYCPKLGFQLAPKP